MTANIEEQQLREEEKQTSWFIVNTWATIIGSAAGLAALVISLIALKATL